MQGEWEKISFFELGVNKPSWMVSHCQLPTALQLNDELVRVFFASRNAEQISCVGYVDVRIDSAGVEYINLGESPVLRPGGIGTFDEHGVFPSSIVRFNGEYLLYFIGWNRGYEAPLFYASIGVASSRDGLSFEKKSNSPLLSRSEYDPCLVTSPHVFIDEGIWRMTYVSGIGWFRDRQTNQLQSRYHIKYAEAANPYDWHRDGRVAIDFLPGETNIARPSVVKISQGRYCMWYSFVAGGVGKYRIGYAESTDCYNWQRMDAMSGISLDDKYATEMICYPCVFVSNGNYYMLYNGDSFGKHGFGIARWCN